MPPTFYLQQVPSFIISMLSCSICSFRPAGNAEPKEPTHDFTVGLEFGRAGEYIADVLKKSGTEITVAKIMQIVWTVLTG